MAELSNAEKVVEKKQWQETGGDPNIQSAFRTVRLANGFEVGAEFIRDYPDNTALVQMVLRLPDGYTASVGSLVCSGSEARALVSVRRLGL